MELYGNAFPTGRIWNHRHWLLSVDRKHFEIDAFRKRRGPDNHVISLFTWFLSSNANSKSLAIALFPNVSSVGVDWGLLIIEIPVCSAVPCITSDLSGALRHFFFYPAVNQRLIKKIRKTHKQRQRKKMNRTTQLQTSSLSCATESTRKLKRTTGRSDCFTLVRAIPC